MIRISVTFHWSVPTNRTLSSTGPLSVQLKRGYVLNAYLYCVYALVGGAISIRDPYICAVSLVCANESHAVFHGPVVCAVKT